MMKADDPRFEKARQEAIERVKRVDEMMVTVLKNHLAPPPPRPAASAGAAINAQGGNAARRRARFQPTHR
jgi:hypothetical protein